MGWKVGNLTQTITYFQILVLITLNTPLMTGIIREAAKKVPLLMARPKPPLELNGHRNFFYLKLRYYPSFRTLMYLLDGNNTPSLPPRGVDQGEGVKELCEHFFSFLDKNWIFRKITLIRRSAKQIEILTIRIYWSTVLHRFEALSIKRFIF